MSSNFMWWTILHFVILVSAYGENSDEIVGDHIEGSEITITDFGFFSDKQDQIPKCNVTIGLKIQCADCKNLLFCASGATVACPSRLPYCNKGQCGEELNDECTLGIGDVCPIYSENKYYPDVKNCYVYYYCDSDSVATNAYSCPINFPFDMATQTCKRSGTCGTFNCYGKEYATYSSDSSLGIACSDNKIVDGTFIACPKGQEIDSSFSCMAKCLKEGNIPHETNKNLYYRCLASGPWGALVKTLMNCPRGQIFNNEKLVCVSKK